MKKLAIKRNLRSILKKLARDYSVIAIIGPRQSGKTTLAKEIFPKKPYINLEAIDTRTLATEDPRGFFSAYPQGCILDEIQKAPHLLSYIQELVDENAQAIKGQFILTGIKRFCRSRLPKITRLYPVAE